MDVFISYKREERQRCEIIAAKLRALGLDVWQDARLESGKSFDREIEQNIYAAKAVLVLWSIRSVESEWVRNEATIGQQRGVLAAAQLEPCRLPINFTNTHFELLLEPDFEDDHPGWLKLLERIGKLVERPGLAAYSEALAHVKAPLLAWAQEFPRDPLALRLAHVDTTHAPAGASMRGLASLAWPVAIGVAVFSALLGAGAVAAAQRLSTPPPAAQAASLSPELSAAASLLGDWHEAGDPDCKTPLALSFQGVQLAMTMPDGSGGKSRDVKAIDKLLPGGWLKLEGKDDVALSLQRTGDNLVLRVGTDPSSDTQYARCKS